MSVEFKINEFEGPLDLLLHLIKESKMDIMDIEIEKITEQYMSYLDSQEKMNLEIASEYLVLASELIEIKSKLLLPNQKSEEINNEEEEDPRDDLVKRLLEYQAYKEITKVLQEKEEIRHQVFTKIPEDYSKYSNGEVIVQCEYEIDDLVNALKNYLLRKKESRPVNTKVTVNEISVSSRRHEIKNVLRSKKKISFFELFPVFTKEYIVATFLAVLEMAKSKELVIKQDKEFEDIICEVVTGEE